MPHFKSSIPSISSIDLSPMIRPQIIQRVCFKQEVYKAQKENDQVIECF